MQKELKLRTWGDFEMNYFYIYNAGTCRMVLMDSFKALRPTYAGTSLESRLWLCSEILG